MQKLLILLLLAITLFSCSKDSDKEPKEEPLYDVSFNVSTFKQDVSNMKSTEPLNEVIKSLIYFVYNNEGKYLYYREFESTEENFGIINDKLPEGEYKIIFLACNEDINSDDFEDIIDNTEAVYHEWDGVVDTFHKKISVTVPNDNSDFSVTLERVVGKLEVIFTDNIPEEAHEIEYSLTGLCCGIHLFTGNPENQKTFSKSAISIVSERGKPNYKLEFYAFVGSESVRCNLTMNVFDQEKNLIATKNIRDINLFRNKIVRLSGDMFTSNNGTEKSFSIKIDDDWSEIIEKGFENGEGGDNDETVPVVNFASPSVDAYNPTIITAGGTVTFSGIVSDNQKMKSITFTDLTQRTKSVNDFLEDFNSKLNNKLPSSDVVIDKSEFEVNFSIETIAGAPAGEYTLTCTVIDQSDNQTTKTFYLKVE